MRKNVASQVVGAQLVSATDGSAFTGSVTCYVTGDGGTQAAGSVGSGACTHEGNGFHTYAPAQAETNYNHVAFTFTGTGAVPVTVQVYTLGHYDVGGATIVAASVTGAVGSVTGAVGSVTGNVGGNVTGSVGSISGVTFPTNFADLSIASSTGLVSIGTGSGLTAIPWNAAWDAEVQSEVADALAVYDPPTATEMTAAFTEIKGATWATTDTLEAIRDRGDAAWTTATGFSTLDAAGVRTAVGLASANLDTQLADIPTVSEFNARTVTAATYATAANQTTIEGKIDTVDGIVDSILADTGTDGVVVAAASKTGYELTSGERTNIAAAVFAYAVETGHSFANVMKRMSAVLLGKASGAATTTNTFRDLTDTRNAVSATVDADGNRSTLTYTDS